MDAILFALVLFLFFTLVGNGVFSIFPPRLDSLGALLASPAVGLAPVVLLVFALNRMGLPVQQFARPLFISFTIVSIAAIAIRRTAFPWKELRFALPILLVALLVSAWPMFWYNFDWVSFANDDMANYALGAERFLRGGFFAEPNFDAMLSGRDYAGIYWEMHVGAGIRAGSELMLAAIWAVSGLNAHFIFMPVMLALHLSLIAVTGAMAVTFTNSAKTAFIAMLLMAFSAMSTLGMLYQLIAQVGGLALLSAAVLLAYRPAPAQKPAAILVSTVPAATVFAALFVWYPELLPFFGLGWIVYFGSVLFSDRHKATGVIVLAAIIGILIVVFLNRFVFDAMIFMLAQSQGGLSGVQQSDALFPYFLVPSGMAASLGLLPIGGQVKEPWLSLAIFVAALILLWLAVKVIPSRLKNSDPAVSIFTVMAAIGLMLFFRNVDFGLFKLVMYIQPFLVCVIAGEIGRWKLPARRPYLRSVLSACGVAVIAPMAICQLGYVSKSTGELLGGLSEMPHASSQKISRQFSEFAGQLSHDGKVGYYADTTNIVLAKFQGFYAQGMQLIFPSRYFFERILEEQNTHLKFGYKDKDFKISEQFAKAKKDNLVERHITDGDAQNDFLVPKNLASILAQFELITTTENQEIFNKKVPKTTAPYFALNENPKDELLFVNSKLGNHYYLGQAGKISYYQLENDPMFHGQIFCALGRRLLFMAIRPSQEARIRMELTSTVLKDYGSELPAAKVQGNTLGFVGRGSGRVFSQPVAFTLIEGVNYVSVDFNRVPIQPTTPTGGLMNLYGRGVHPDPRHIAVFGRDISLVSSADYEALKAPSSLQTFPADLANENLEYSGIYEDGWISERSFFSLSSQASTKFVTMRGMLPQLDDANFSTTVKVSLDGKPLGEVPIKLGAFEVKLPVTTAAGKHRVDYEFTRYQTLPGADGRITGGKIDFIGFTED